MTNFQKAIKYSLIYGFIGAVIFPFIHESYANIGKTFSLALLTILVIVMTIRLSQFSPRHAFLGITITLTLSSVLGTCLYLIIHEKVVDFLQKNSRYFYIGVTEHFRYYAFVALILLSSYLLCLILLGFKKLVKNLSDNQTSTKDYIDNAFNDENTEG